MSSDKMRIINVGNLIGNQYLLKLDGGYLLIDTGYSEQFGRFRDSLARNKIGLNEIPYVLLTHAHDDHAGFLGELLDNSDARVILHQKAIDRLKSGQNSFEGGCTSLLAFAFCNVMKLIGKGEHRFRPVDRKDRYVTVDEMQNTALRNQIPGVIINLPGHTEDSIGLLLHDGSLFCGDAAMNGFPSARKMTIWVENLTDYANSWELMIERNPRVIYPGHGKPFDVDDLRKGIGKVGKTRLRALK